MLSADGALMGAKQPPFEKRSNAMHIRQQFRRQFFTSVDDRDFVRVSNVRQSPVGFPAVGMNHCSRLNYVLNKRQQACLTHVGDSSQPNPANPGTGFFGGDHDDVLLVSPTPSPACGSTADISLVNLQSLRMNYHRLFTAARSGVSRGVADEKAA